MNGHSSNKPDILCFSSSDWYGKWGSRQQVMMRLAALGHRVLFIEWLAGLEHFWKYKDLRQRRRQNWREGLRQIKPNLWLLSPPPLLPGRYYLASIALVNAFVIQLWIKPYLRNLMISQPVLWLYLPEYAFLVGRFDERLAVYHCIDEFAAGTQGRKRRVILALETNLLNRVNLVFANSMLTYQNKRKLNVNTYHLPSGADVEHFAKVTNSTTKIHADVVGLPRPILAVVGNINEKINISLLAYIARARPHWSILMVGQVNHYSIDLQPLQSLTNIHRVGRQPFEILPTLLKGVDVCLLPYVQGDATRYRSPLKLYEYLATGKPIVSTPHPEVDEFEGLVKIALENEFVEAIEEAVRSDTSETQQQRLEAAQQHSWDARVRTINKILTKYWE